MTRTDLAAGFPRWRHPWRLPMLATTQPTRVFSPDAPVKAGVEVEILHQTDGMAVVRITSEQSGKRKAVVKDYIVRVGAATCVVEPFTSGTGGEVVRYTLPISADGRAFGCTCNDAKFRGFARKCKHTIACDTANGLEPLQEE